MRRYAPWLIGLVLSASPARAEAPGRTIEDAWDAAYLQGVQTGFFHTTVRETERDGAKYLQTTVEMDLRIKRYNATVQLRMITGNEETPDGKVTAVSMTQFLDRGKQLVLKGAVEGKQLHITVDDPPIDKGASIDNSDLCGLVIVQIVDTYPGIERQRTMRGRHLLHVVNFTIGCRTTVIGVAIPTG